MPAAAVTWNLSTSPDSWLHPPQGCGLLGFMAGSSRSSSAWSAGRCSTWRFAWSRSTWPGDGARVPEQALAAHHRPGGDLAGARAGVTIALHEAGRIQRAGEHLQPSGRVRVPRRPEGLPELPEVPRGERQRAALVGHDRGAPASGRAARSTSTTTRRRPRWRCCTPACGCRTSRSCSSSSCWRPGLRAVDLHRARVARRARPRGSVRAASQDRSRPFSAAGSPATPTPGSGRRRTPSPRRRRSWRGWPPATRRPRP